MKKIFTALLLTVISSISLAQDKLQLIVEGILLRQFYLSQNVENLWLSGHHINWETGDADNPNATKGIKTHCSAFVASVCKQKNIYILRPPEHSQGLLANAQYDWLFSEDAFNKGWRQIKDSSYIKAQKIANQGFIVTAITKNSNPKNPGHIALVMPVEKSINDLNTEGPTLIQAGKLNRNYISLKDGFKNHFSEWKFATNEIKFFYIKIRKPFDER